MIFLIIIYSFIIRGDSRGGVSSPGTGENSPSFIRGSLMLQSLLSQVSSDTAWPWHSAHYLYGSINGFHDASSSSLKIPQMKSFFCVQVL